MTDNQSINAATKTFHRPIPLSHRWSSRWRRELDADLVQLTWS